MHLCIPLLSILLSKGTWLKPPQATFTLSCHSMTCSRYGFHTDRSCSDLRLGFRYSPRFSCLCIHRLSFFGRETRPLLFSKNYLIGGACNTHLHHSIFKEQRNFLRSQRDSNSRLQSDNLKG